MPEWNAKANDIFLRAVEIEVPADRQRFLNEQCGDDVALRAQVESLLAASAKVGSFLERRPDWQNATVNYQPIAERPGTVIGPYKLLQQIGEGGMGVVFMADQTQPVQRRVALKIIKPGMDSAQVIARFEAERQALAMMDHHNIARVLEAGTTDGGRPYFVMELVHGIPITQFCDESKLTPRERLALFVPVCQAIQHAHQKGIIHRDIKPSNVLVTMYDDKPVPKVIDFGVAKAVEQRLTEKTMFTQFGTLVGTFEYMSPEQAEMNALGVDTRSDIYSLGVLLYELLTGSTPLEKKRLRGAALDEMVRLIKEEEAPRPSLRLSSSDNLPKIAAARKMEPGQLSKLVRGEIDWIVMKCLEKDRSRRYDTASGLARDVERYLSDEPVEACPPSTRYRLSKFARKYKKALVTAAAFAAILVIGAVLSTLLAVWATSAESKANLQRIASDEAKQDALEAKQAALDAKVEAVKQRDEARLTAYAAGINLAQRYWEEKNVLRAQALLKEVPTHASGRDLRGFEWYYLSHLCGSLLLTLKGHTGTVETVAFSPDGRRLASGGIDATVRIWESETGRELLCLKGHNGWVNKVAFSPDGRRLASGSQDGVKIWDSETGRELLSLKGNSDSVDSVAFSPDGRRLASGSRKEVKIWDSATGKELLAFKRESGSEGNSLVFSPDGRRLASGSGKEVKIWDSATGKELLSLKGHTSSVTSVAFSPDGQRLASGSSGWHSTPQTGTARERLASKGPDQTVRIWDSVTGNQLLALNDHVNAGVSCVAFSPDGLRLASACRERTVKIWDSATGKALFALKGHIHFITSVAFSPAGRRLASGSYDQAVMIWDCVAERGLFSISERGSARIVTFSPDGQHLASDSDDKTVKIWDSATGRELFALKGHTDVLSCVAFSPDGRRLASGSGDHTVKIWDSLARKELVTLKGHAGPVSSVAFSPDGRRLASGSDDHTVKIWDSATGKELLALKGHADGVTSVAFSPDGLRLASGSGDKTVNIWDSSTGKELFALKGHADGVTSVTFSPDGRRLASGSNDHTVKIWDSATGKELLALNGHDDWVTSVAFSPDGLRLASASYGSNVDMQGTVKIWHSVTGKELLNLKGDYFHLFKSVTFSPDGQRLVASGDGGGFVILWESRVPPEVQDRRATNRLVADLFREMLLRADVLERLHSLFGLSQTRREAALAAAQTYPEDPKALNQLALQLVALPNQRELNFRSKTGGYWRRLDYTKALRYSETACQLEPKNGLYLTTLGMAYYRAGNYLKALETLLRSDSINKTQFQGSIPADLAFLAMTQQRLGHAKEARAYLQQLRKGMKDAGWAKNAEWQSFMREAETLLAKPTTPDSK